MSQYVEETDARELRTTTSIPQQFYQEAQNLSVSLNGKGTGRILEGAVVFDKNKRGSLGFVACDNGKIGGQAVQRMIVNTHSSHGMPTARVFDFTKAPDMLSDRQENQLFLNVFDVANAPQMNDKGDYYKSMAKYGGLPIPIIVGPGSVSLANEPTNDELEALGMVGIDWGSLAKGVVEAIPTLADTALKIYKEVNAASTSSDEKEEVGGIFGTIGSVIDSAIPFVAALI